MQGFCRYDIFKNVVKGNVIYIRGNRFEVLETENIKLTKVKLTLKNDREKISVVRKMIDTEVIIGAEEQKNV